MNDNVDMFSHNKHINNIVVDFDNHSKKAIKQEITFSIILVDKENVVHLIHHLTLYHL